MRTCELCQQRIPLKIKIEGRLRNLQNRRYCLTCSPFGAHNTRQLELAPTAEAQQAKTAEMRRNSYRKYQRKTRRQRKRLLVRLLGGCCQICGYDRDCPAAYDFHHPDPAAKTFDLGTRGLLGRWDELIAEIRKCVLLCRRCHAEVHAGMHEDCELRWRGQVAQLV